MLEDKMQQYKITMVVELEPGALKHDDWIFRAIEECLENKEDIVSYKLEPMDHETECGK